VSNLVDLCSQVIKMAQAPRAFQPPDKQTRKNLHLKVCSKMVSFCLHV